jgi:hypothetical protein
VAQSKLHRWAQMPAGLLQVGRHHPAPTHCVAVGQYSVLCCSSSQHFIGGASYCPSMPPLLPAEALAASLPACSGDRS